MRVKIVPTASFLNFYNPLEGTDFYFRLAALSIIGADSECVYWVGDQATVMDTDERKMCIPCPINVFRGSNLRASTDTKSHRPFKLVRKRLRQKKDNQNIYTAKNISLSIHVYFSRTVKEASQPKHVTQKN